MTTGGVEPSPKAVAKRRLVQVLLIGLPLSFGSTMYTHYVGWDALGWSSYVLTVAFGVAFWALVARIAWLGRRQP